MVAYLGEDFLDTEWGLGSDIIFDIRFHRSGKFTELLHVLNRDRLHFHLYFLILCFRDRGGEHERSLQDLGR